LAKTFNMGIGMVLIVSSENKKSAISVLQEHGEQVYEIGKLVRKEEGVPGCTVQGSEVWTA
jgi:homoserine kinase